LPDFPDLNDGKACPMGRFTGDTQLTLLICSRDTSLGVLACCLKPDLGGAKGLPMVKPGSALEETELALSLAGKKNW